MLDYSYHIAFKDYFGISCLGVNKLRYRKHVHVPNVIMDVIT